MTNRWSVTIDCAHPAALASFWALALGYREAAPPSGFDSWPAWLVHHGVPADEWDDGAYLADPEGVGPRLSFLKVPEPKVVKNRVHLDVHVDGSRDAVPWEQRWPQVQAAADRLVAAGGTLLQTYDMDGRPDNIVMQDPEGNECCVA